MHGYEKNSIEKDGVPLVPHVHGGKNDSSSDGNPEFFFSPGNEICGPRYVEDESKYGGSDWYDVVARSCVGHNTSKCLCWSGRFLFIT